MLRAHGVTDRGRLRPVNEDCFGIAAELQLCLVADGMGGHNAGEVAARIAVDAVTDFVAEGLNPPFSSGDGISRWPFGYDASLSDAGNVLRTAVYLANLRILETAVLAREYAGMGTTIVAALVRDGRLSVAHVGDSRLYVRGNGSLRQLTIDDSWMTAAVAADARLDRAMLAHHPMRHALTNVVGARTRTEVHVVEEPLRGGELIALTTDGVHGVLDDRRIQELIDGAGRVADVPAALVRSAIARGSRDNCTVVVGECAS
jgi:protein phosphatase